MLLNTIYEHSINKQDWKGIFNIVSDVKYHFDVCYINFRVFHILIYTLNDKP